MLRETLGFLHFLLKQTTALIKIFQIKLSFIKLQYFDIKLLDLEKHLLNDILLWKIKKFGGKYNILQAHDWSQSCTWWV